MTAPVVTVGEAIAQARTNVFVQDAPVTGVRRLIAYALGVNINAANTDAAIPLILLGGNNFVVREVMVNNAQINNGGVVTNSVTNATVGLFTAATGGGLALVATAVLSALTALTGAGSNQDMVMAAVAATATLNQATQANLLYLRTSTAQGASTSATVDVYIWAHVLP